MIPVSSFSASSVSSMAMCEMKWFLNYILYYREPSGNAAALGSAAHDVLEAVAQQKLLKQNKKRKAKHKAIGEFSRRMSLDSLIEKSFKHHKKINDHLDWGDTELKEVSKYVYKAKDHEFYPENLHEIVEPERFFRQPIPYSWAEYTVLENENVKQKHLMVSGKIDIIFRGEDGTLNYLDYKFGKKGPYDWANFKEKSYNDMMKDIQLCLYYWAVKEMFPDEDPVSHIWYVNTDLLWSYSFTKEQQDHAMHVLRNVFERTKCMEKPATRYGRHCNFCSYKNSTLENWTNIESPQANSDSDKFPDINGKKCACDAVKYFTRHRSVDTIIDNCKKPRS